jgi:hypothetical protein
MFSSPCEIATATIFSLDDRKQCAERMYALSFGHSAEGVYTLIKYNSIYLFCIPGKARAWAERQKCSFFDH